MMKEHPILFSAEMIRAILDGQKTQTRRVLKRAIAIPHEGRLEMYHENQWCVSNRRGDILDSWVCPYGKPGDRLWVRETFQVENTQEYNGEEILPKDGRPIKILNDDDGAEYKLIPRYRATEPDTFLCISFDEHGADKMVWKPSIFMPHWASRILLEVTDVRVERVQEITEEDSTAEGVAAVTMADVPRQATMSNKGDFKQLWNKINAKRGYGWDKNPWCWVVSFKRIKP